MIGETAKHFSDLVAEMSGGSIEVRYLDPGALVPSPEIFDAVGSGRIEMGYSWNGFQAGKVPAILVFNAIPFGPSHDTMMAWLMEGGGKEMISANATEYGLVAYVYTADVGRGLALCERLDFGMVGLNRGLVSDPAAPFGGTKQSGIGREGGQEGMRELMETQYVSVNW